MSGDAGASALEKTADWYADHPHARSSFSRLATYRRCPAWYRYQYLGWHRSWAPAVTRAGQIVQEVLERMFDAGPAEEVGWDAIEERAHARGDALFDRIWDRVRAEHEADPNGYGPWDLPRDRYAGHVRRGLELHLREVKSRVERVHPRTAATLDLQDVPSLREAWMAVLPVHAPPGSPPMDSMESVPDGYFQGQCDLVYTWTGGRRLVDLKASSGASAFSTEIRTQLLAYSYLDRALGRGRPEGIEAWFLGKAEPDVFDVPGDEAIDAFDEEVKALIVRSGHERGFGQWRREDFPPEPAPVAGKSAPADAPSAWCAFCPAASLCPRSPRRAPPVGEGVPLNRIPSRAPRAGLTVEGVILGVAAAIERAGKTTRRVTIANETGLVTGKWDADHVLRMAEQGLRAGRHVRITGLNPWSPPNSSDVLLFPSHHSSATVLAEEGIL